jgi:peroxiredoxin
MTMKIKSLFALVAVGTMALAAAAQTSTNIGPDGKPTTSTTRQPEHPKAEHPKKAEKADAQAKVGEAAPKFTLMSTEGKEVKLEDFKGKIVVLEWFNPECPFVKKHHDLNTTMADTFAKYKDKDVVWLAINSGAEGKQGFGKELNEQARKDWKLGYPVLLDESGKVGKTYGAKTTPHMYVINKEGVLVYAGAIDDNTSAKEAGKVNYVANALDATIKGETVKEAETKPYGCSVKYAGK